MIQGDARNIHFPLSPQTRVKSASYVIYTLYYTQKQVILKELQNFLGINTTIFANLILSKSI